MGESAPTLTSACHESAILRPMLVKAEKWVSLAPTMWSAEGTWLVDQVLSGPMKLNACPWVMSIPGVRLIMIASPGTSAGKKCLAILIPAQALKRSLPIRFASRSTPPQMMRKFSGIRLSIPIEIVSQM